MDRLTYLHMRGSENDGYYLRPGTTREKANAKLAAYEATNRTPEQLAALVKAQREVRLVELPDNFKQLCDALGDSIWHLMVDGEITESTLTNICFDDNAMLCLEFGSCGYRWDVPISTFGKTVFLTYAEAKAALKG